MSYSKRKVDAAYIQIGLLRSALFNLENRLCCGIYQNPEMVKVIRAMWLGAGAMEMVLDSSEFPRTPPEARPDEATLQ